MDAAPTEQAGTASTQLAALAQAASEAGTITLGELLAAMGRTSIAFAILILSLPALTPIPGPFGMVFGTCLAFVSLQIMAGNRSIWLPRILARRRLSAGTVELVVRHTSPLVRRVETILRRDRMRPLTGRTAETLLGIPVFLLAVAVALPIPFGNVLPVAALVVIAMGLMERDGLATLLGIVLAAVALSTTGGLIYGTAAALGWAAG
ncbi:MAG: exopolysaccharide biosynthesis protein [Arenimonas sp.]|nr:exopolysaccharide biosynthesis protein [Rhizobium sp.]MBW8445921.1 exopolysaccharide biosynthesis protein [Arenimonas sp.]